MKRGTNAMTDQSPLPARDHANGDRTARRRPGRLVLALVAVLALGWASGVLPRAWESGQQQRHQDGLHPAGSEHLPITTTGPLSGLLTRTAAAPSSLDSPAGSDVVHRLAALHGRFGFASLAKAPEPREPATLAAPGVAGIEPGAEKASYGLVASFGGDTVQGLAGTTFSHAACCEHGMTIWLALTLRVTQEIERTLPWLAGNGPHAI